MSWWQWGLAVLGGLIVAVVFSVWVAYRLSPEGREDAAVRRRMDAQARRARRELYEDRHAEVREQLRRERGAP